MNKTQENRLTMYEAVATLLGSNPTITSAIPAFSTAAATFNSLIGQIKDKGREKSEALSGKTSNKLQAEDALVRVLMEIGRPMVAYANTVNNNQLLDIVSVSESRYRLMRDTELVSKAKSILQQATQYLSSLAGYGIVQEKLDDLQAKTDAFDAALGKRESSVAERVGATAALTALFEQTDDVLAKEMDNIVEAIRSTQTQFYNEYFAARVVKELGIRHEAKQAPAAPAAVAAK